MENFSPARRPSGVAPVCAPRGTFAETGVRAKDGEDYATLRLRNIMSSDTDLTAGTSPLPSGSIYIVFE